MLKWLAIVGCVLVPALVLAQGATNPEFVRIQEGNDIPQPTPVVCATASTPLWNNPAATPNAAGNVRSITFTNSTTFATLICPSTSCTATKATWLIPAAIGAGVVIDRSVRDRSWSCLAVGGSSSILIGVEQ